nr:bifunctional UDP-sugar hydrolase/5'-nucleotidase UshA [Sansalvadorimonas sp. 2012CJ34-2]
MASVIAATLAGCATTSAPAPQWEEGKTYDLTVLHTNDNHGRFWHDKRGQYGMAARKTLIDQIRAEVEAEGGQLLLLSGGDINTGVPESDLQDAEPDFKGMSRIGYDAMALGNHEFDNPLKVLLKQEEWSNFPFLAANIYKDGNRLFDPYKIFEKGDMRIAVIGLTTEDTAKLGNPEFISDITFTDPKVEARKVIAEIKQTENPDIIIAATHMGHYQNAMSGINAPGDVTLARSLEVGDLDMIIGGHSQEPVCMEGKDDVNEKYKPGMTCTPDQQNGTWIMQAHEWGKYVGRADYEFKNGELKLVSYDLIPVNLKKKIKVDGKKTYVLIEDEIKQDPELKEFLKPYQEKGQDSLQKKVAETDAKLEGDRNVVRFQQTNLGHIIAQAQAERSGADFGVMNSGGVRDSLSEGEITYKDVLTVQPFGNIITTVTMSAPEVIEYLNTVATKPVDSGAYAQFWNISMRVEGGKVHDVKVGGEPIDMSKSYSFSIPSYNAAGGDGYPKINNHPNFVNTGFVDAEVLKEFLESHSPIEAQAYAPKGEMIYR